MSRLALAVLDSKAGTVNIDDGLTACDRVAIHTPGSIQPHGILFVADANTRTVVAGAGHIKSLFAPEWLGRTLAALLGPNIASALDAISTSTGVALGRAHGVSGPFEVVAHHVGGYLLIELEPAPLDTPSAVEVFPSWKRQQRFSSARPIWRICAIGRRASSSA